VGYAKRVIPGRDTASRRSVTVSILFLLSTVLGLPAHPLIVHVAVVLVPLAAIALLLTCWRDSWRERYLFPILLITLVAAVATILASNTGEALQETVRNGARAAGASRPDFGEHPEQGDTARNFTLLFTVAVGAFWAIDWSRRLGGMTALPFEAMRPIARIGAALPAWSPRAAYVVAVIPGVFAMIGIIIAGHSGATLVWKDIGTYTKGH
jgi:hypothetical protein